MEGGRRPKGLLIVGRSPEGLLGRGRSSKLLLRGSRLRPEEAGFWPEEPASSAKSRLPWPKAGFLARKKPALARRSRLTPAYAGFFHIMKPAYAGLRRLPSAKEEAGFLWSKPASLAKSRLFQAKAGFFPAKEAGFSGQSRLLSARKAGQSRLTPAPRFLWAPRGRAGQSRLSRLPFGQERAGLHRPKKPASLARKGAGFCRLRRLPFRGAQRGEYVTAGTAQRAVSSFLHDVISEAAPSEARSFCGKHSYRAQRKEGSRRKPAFPLFSWVGKAGFCRLWPFPAFPAKRGLDHLR